MSSEESGPRMRSNHPGLPQSPQSPQSEEGPKGEAGKDASIGKIDRFRTGARLIVEKNRFVPPLHVNIEAVSNAARVLLPHRQQGFPALRGHR